MLGERSDRLDARRADLEAAREPVAGDLVAVLVHTPRTNGRDGLKRRLPGGYALGVEEGADASRPCGQLLSGGGCRGSLAGQARVPDDVIRHDLPFRRASDRDLVAPIPVADPVGD